jgi:hypothetical protein
MVAPGVYRHYKGGEYRVLFTAKHSETEELMVVYCHLPDPPGILGAQHWVRPLSMFEEHVAWPDGSERPRFERHA